ncbi:MAG: glycosyltransferase family 4 protein [Patescibacteria group bacterium]
MQIKKILIATGIYPPDIGGPATYSKILHDELPKHDISVSVLSFGEVRSMPKVIRHLAYLFLVLARGRDADLIFAQDPVSVGLPAFLAARILRVKFALKIVGDYAWEQGAARFGVTDLLDDFWASPGYHPIFVRLLQAVESFVARRADIIIVPSKYLKKIVGYWGVSRDKIYVIYNSFDGTVEKAKEETKTEKIIVSAGRLVPWKGFVTLMAVMPPLLKHFPDVKLIIAGDGPDRAMLERSIREMSLESSVFLVGSLSREKLFKYIRSASVFALNTSYEGFSHQLLEVMAIGTPIVTTNAGGNPEIIRNEENGLLVEPDDRDALVNAIERVLVDDDLAFRLSQGAKETVATFTSARMVAETIRTLSLIA